MAFPTTGVLDDFTGPDEALSARAGWAEPLIFGQSDDFNIVSGELHSNTPVFSDSNAYWNTAFGPGSEVYVDVVTFAGGTDEIALYARCNTPGVGMNGYIASYSPGEVQLGYWKGGAQSLPSSKFLTIAVGDTIGLEVVDNGSVVTLNAWVKHAGVWSLVSTWDDTGPPFGGPGLGSTGFVGIEVAQAGTVVDNFSGGTIFTVAPQELRPAADAAVGGWAVAPLFSKVNETAADGTVISATAV